ncbi:MAG: DUF1868 domain-containing protein [Hoeflea sp.]|uniref:DUF1868 domain-containing protein n=1 Tax=Hoeflea sp. TaxID=1940281 RepID=UPI0032ED2635
MPYKTLPEFHRAFCGEGQDASPAMLGTRFDRRGNFLQEPGNTIVCHVPDGSRTQTAMVKVRDRLQALDAGGHFTWTPVSSYHMTLFNGVIESQRAREHWPADLPLDASIHEATDYLAPRLSEFRGMAPFSVKLESVTPLGLLVTGASADDEATIRRIRDELTIPFGFRKPGHDGYPLHLTLGYILRWLPRELAPVYMRELEDIGETFRRDVPVLELGPAEFCTFRDMNHFEPVLRLS